MRWSIVLVILPFALAMSAGALQAQCNACEPVNPCPAPVATCPPPAPVCAPACPAPVTCAPIAVASTCDPCSLPAGIGAGPMGELQGVCGVNFDVTYIRTMYQQNADVAALAAYGAEHVTSGDLRWLSQKIVRERSDMNAKFSQWYPKFACGPLPCLTTDRVDTIIQGLSGCCGAEFDRKYASTMVALMTQSMESANLGVQQAVSSDVRNQAKLSVRTNSNEINAFNKWLQYGHF